MNRLRFTPHPDNLPTNEVNGETLNNGNMPPVEFNSPNQPITIEIMVEAESQNEAAAVYRAQVIVGDGGNVNQVTFGLSDEFGPSIEAEEGVGT